jgi:hypothetical protein
MDDMIRQNPLFFLNGKEAAGPASSPVPTDALDASGDAVAENFLKS